MTVARVTAALRSLQVEEALLSNAVWLKNFLTIKCDRNVFSGRFFQLIFSELEFNPETRSKCEPNRDFNEIPCGCIAVSAEQRELPLVGCSKSGIDVSLVLRPNWQSLKFPERVGSKQLAFLNSIKSLSHKSLTFKQSTFEHLRRNPSA